MVVQEEASRTEAAGVSQVADPKDRRRGDQITDASCQVSFTSVDRLVLFDLDGTGGGLL